MPMLRVYEPIVVEFDGTVTQLLPGDVIRVTVKQAEQCFQRRGTFRYVLYEEDLYVEKATSI